MIKFGVSDSLVVPLLVPGLLFSVGATALWAVAQPDVLRALVGTVREIAKAGSGAHGTAAATAILGATAVMLYICSLVTGLIVAVISGYVELRILDEDYIVRFEINRDVYYKQWYDYLDHLETVEQPHPYFAGLADFFLCLLRSSVAFGLLALASFACLLFVHATVGVQSLSAVTLVLAFVAFMTARKYHEELADFRARRFGGTPPALMDVKSIVTEMISMWCKRHAIRPLATILPIHVQPNGYSADPAWRESLKRGLIETTGFNDGSVLPAEVVQLNRALQMLG